MQDNKEIGDGIGVKIQDLAYLKTLMQYKMIQETGYGRDKNK